MSLSLKTFAGLAIATALSSTVFAQALITQKNISLAMAQTIALFNPVVYLISGFRWSFFEIADVGHGVSVGMTLLFLAACLVTVWWMFRTGYKLKK